MKSRPDLNSSRRDASIGGVRIDFENVLRFLEPKHRYVGHFLASVKSGHLGTTVDISRKLDLARRN